MLVSNTLVVAKPLELTVEITNYCPYNCEFCSSDATVNGKPLAYEEIVKFLEQYSNIDIINISGGEPLSHPDFYKILQYCKSRARIVWVYTNEISNIAFNSAVIPEVNVRANVCLVPNSYDIHIPKGSFQVNLLRYIKQGRAKEEPVFMVSSSINKEACHCCTNKVLMANGKVVDAPCKKS